MVDRSDHPADAIGDAPPVVDHTVPPGSDEHAEAVWTLKERIRRLDGLLVQQRPFFDAQYRQSTCHLAVAVGRWRRPVSQADGDGEAIPAGLAQTPDGVVGFAIVTPDGYLSLLGVAPAYRRQGLGTWLLERVAADHPAVSCHVRTTNDSALGFYADHGFVVDGCVERYYRDGTAAYRMVRAPDRADRLADVLS